MTSGSSKGLANGNTEAPESKDDENDEMIFEITDQEQSESESQQQDEEYQDSSSITKERTVSPAPSTRRTQKIIIPKESQNLI